MLEECFCTFGEEIFNKPAFKSESDLSSMEVGMDNQEKIEEDPTTDEDNVVHLGTALTNARDNVLKDKLQVDCTDTCCPDELGSVTDEHEEKSTVMQSLESVFDENGKSCMVTINAQAVGLVTSAEGIIAEDKGISYVALHCKEQNISRFCYNLFSKDSPAFFFFTFTDVFTYCSSQYF